MRVAIFGASGATGQFLTERSLVAGHQVTALVRTPESFPFRDKVRVVRGSAFDLSAITDTLSGADAVLSCLGARSLKKEDVLERAVPLIVKAMETSGAQRIIALGSSGALPTALDKQAPWRAWLIQNLVYTTFLKHAIASQVAQYAILSSSRLDWTMVMPPRLRNGPARGRFRVDGAALPRNGFQISRTDVADFMMQQLASAEWSRKGVYLAW